MLKNLRHNRALIAICLCFAFKCPIARSEGRVAGTPLVGPQEPRISHCSAKTDPFIVEEPCLLKDGWVFSPEKALEVRNKIIDLDYYKDENNILKKILTYKDNNIKMLTEVNESNVKFIGEQAQIIKDTRTVSDLQKFIYFGLGVIVTGTAAYVLRQTIK